MAEYCQNAAVILTYIKVFWQDYAVKIFVLMRGRELLEVPFIQFA